jgi:hypothetical protein
MKIKMSSKKRNVVLAVKEACHAEMLPSYAIKPATGAPTPGSLFLVCSTLNPTLPALARSRLDKKHLLLNLSLGSSLH